MAAGESINKAFRQAIIIGLINLVLTVGLVFSWSGIISDIRSGETSSYSKRSRSTRHYTWKDDRFGFAMAMAKQNVVALGLSLFWLLLTLSTATSGLPDIIKWIRTAGGRRKLCAACGSDCTDGERLKDDEGNYFCRACYESRCMLCGCDCSNIERVNDNEGHFLCPACFEKQVQLKQSVVELQADVERFNEFNDSLSNMRKRVRRWRKTSR